MGLRRMDIIEPADGKRRNVQFLWSLLRYIYGIQIERNHLYVNHLKKEESIQ